MAAPPPMASTASGMEEEFFLRAEDGKSVGSWALEDGLTRMRQLGLIPSPQPAGEGSTVRPT